MKTSLILFLIFETFSLREDFLLIASFWRWFSLKTIDIIMNWLLQNIPKLNIFIDLELDRKNGLLGKKCQELDLGLLLKSLSLIFPFLFFLLSGWTIFWVIVIKKVVKVIVVHELFVVLCFGGRELIKGRKFSAFLSSLLWKFSASSLRKKKGYPKLQTLRPVLCDWLEDSFSYLVQK